MAEDMILPDNRLYEFKLFVTGVSTCVVDTIGWDAWARERVANSTHRIRSNEEG